MRVTLKTKIVGIAIVPLFVFMTISTFMSISKALSEGEKRIEMYRNNIRNRLKVRTEIALNSIKNFYSKANNEESKQKAMELINNLRYGENGYFWINNLEPAMVIHPFSPHLNGKYVGDYKDPNGVPLFIEFVKIVEGKGEGFFRYMWPKPGFDKPQHKVSYVIGFKPWNWVIGTGVYQEEIDKVVALEQDKIDKNIKDAILVNVLVGLGLVLLVGILAWIFVTKTVVNQIYQLVNTIKGIEGSADFSLRVTETGNDEIAESKKALNGLVSSIQTSLNDLNVFMVALSSGDLTNTITKKSKGDLEDLALNVNKSIEMLTRMITDVKSASKQVNEGAQELAKSSQNLATGNSQQAVAIEQIMSAIDEIEAQTKKDSMNASDVSGLSKQMLQVLEEGNAHMGEMQQSMQEINETGNNVAKIIKDIDEIAFQTNLLALNAAVEAARAGKYGKGFAVVAEEVRNLAGRSAEAAKNTTDLIETSIKKVDTGVNNSDKTAAVLIKISENAEKVNQLVAEIADSAISQSSGIQEVNQSIGQIKTIVEQNAHISEKSASASEELTSLSKNLNEILRKFTINETYYLQEHKQSLELTTSQQAHPVKPPIQNVISTQPALEMRNEQ